VFFSPEGERLLTVSLDKTVRVWDAATAEPVRVFRLPFALGDEGSLYAAALSQDGRRLAVGGVPYREHGGIVHISDLDSGRTEAVIKGYHKTVNTLAFSPDGKYLASAGHDKVIRLHDLGTRQVTRTMEGHAAPVREVAFSPDGRRLASVAA